MRVISSLAALSVNVATIIFSGDIPLFMSDATLSTNVLVFPEPGPAITSTGPSVC